MELRFLNDGDRPAIHQTFRAAFADYAVPADFDAPLLERLMTRRGTDLSASVGAFEDGKMVAVMATAVRDFEGVPSAYDTFTGVLPDWRGQRLASRMFDTARELLAGRGIRRFVLEVIETNEGAIKAYERAGFATRRRLKCFEIPTAALRPVGPPDGVTIEPCDSAQWEHWPAWRDWSATWQNSDASVDDTVEGVEYLEARAKGWPVGYAIVVPQARDLPQLAVHPDFRRRGVGTALLAEAVRRIPDGQNLRVINIDAASVPDLAFYGATGQASLPAQLEMVLDFEA